MRRYAALFWCIAVAVAYLFVCFATLFDEFIPPLAPVFSVGLYELFLGFLAISSFVVACHFLAPKFILRFGVPAAILAAATVIIVRSGSVAGLGIAVLLMAAALGAGDGLMRALRLQSDSGKALETLILKLMAGLAVLGLLGFLLAITHTLLAPVVGLVLGLATVLAIRPLREHRSGHVSQGSELPEASALLAMFGFMALVNLVWTVAPEVQFDALNYHLPVAAAYARSGGAVDLLFTHSYLAGLLETVYSLVFVFGSQAAAEFIPFVLALVATGCVYVLTGHVAGKRAAAWAALLFYSVPLIGWASSTTDVELALSGFIGCMTISVIRWRESGNVNRLYLAAVFFGAGIGVKPTMALFAPAVAVLLLYSVRIRGDAPLRKSLQAIMLFVLISVSTSIPWYGLRAHFTGNPVYPKLNRFFPVERYDDGVGPLLAGNFRVPFELAPLAQFPVAFTFRTAAYSESGVSSGGAGPYLLLAIPALFLVRRRNFAMNLISGLAFTYVVGWALIFSYARFYIPVLPLIVPLSVMIVMAAAGEKTRLAHGVLIVILTGQWMSMPVQFWVIPERIPVRNAFGLEPDEKFLSRTLRGISAANYVNRKACPGDIAIGSGFERVRHYLDVPFHSWRDMPEVREFSHVDEPESLAEVLHEKGYDWLLIDEWEPNRGEQYLAEPFIRCCAELRFRGPHTAVYRLSQADGRCP